MAGGQGLFEQGDDADAIYTLVSGAIGVSTRDPWDGSVRRLARLALPETVGEQVLLAGELRSITATALRDTHLLRLPKDGFEALITRHPATPLSFADQIDCPGCPVCLRHGDHVLLLAELGYRCAREALETGRLQAWA